MDKIKITEITHLMARIRELMDYGVIGCTVNAKGMGESDLQLSSRLFRELFEQNGTAHILDNGWKKLKIEINGVNVVCWENEDEHTD